jgi:hypothetical protein
MKNLNRFARTVLMLLVVFMIIGGCKKNSDDEVVTPTFTITSSTVMLQGGGDGLQFFAKCTNTDVKMTNVTITDPTPFVSTYDLKGESFVKNASIPLQDNDVAYYKEAGTWNFNVVGKRSSDNAAFAVDVTLAVSK